MLKLLDRLAVNIARAGLGVLMAIAATIFGLLVCGVQDFGPIVHSDNGKAFLLLCALWWACGVVVLTLADYHYDRRNGR